MADFIGEAAIDSVRCSTRSMLHTVMAKQALWLKSRSADVSSKQNWCKIPFDGKDLFGEKLDKAISRHKRKIRPVTKTGDPGTPGHLCPDFITLRTRTTGSPDRGKALSKIGKSTESPFPQDSDRDPYPPHRILLNPFDGRPTHAIPVGARLNYFSKLWEKKCREPWVVFTVKYGHF